MWYIIKTTAYDYPIIVMVESIHRSNVILAGPFASYEEAEADYSNYAEPITI